MVTEIASISNQWAVWLIKTAATAISALNKTFPVDVYIYFDETYCCIAQHTPSIDWAILQIASIYSKWLGSEFKFNAAEYVLSYFQLLSIAIEKMVWICTCIWRCEHAHRFTGERVNEFKSELFQLNPFACIQIIDFFLLSLRCL